MDEGNSEISVCTVTVAKGLIREAEETKTTIQNLGILQPRDFAIATDSLIPTKTASYGNDQKIETDTNTVTANQNFGVAPMAIKPEELCTCTKIEIKRKFRQEFADYFDYEPIYKNVQTGIWGKPSIKKEENTILI